MSDLVPDMSHQTAANIALSLFDLSLQVSLHRSEFVYRTRFNLSNEDRDLVADVVPIAPLAHGAHGGPFAVAWRNYIKSMFQKGYMYRLSCKPSAILYIADNKTLAGKEDRTYDGEAMGRKMAVVFFEDLEGNLVRLVNRDALGCIRFS